MCGDAVAYLSLILRHIDWFSGSDEICGCLKVSRVWLDEKSVDVEWWRKDGILYYLVLVGGLPSLRGGY